MSVIMIIVGSLVTALLAIGIIGGVIMSAVAVFRLITGKGTYNGRELNRVKRILISAVCILNAFALLIGGYFGVQAYQIHKDEIWVLSNSRANRIAFCQTICRIIRQRLLHRRMEPQRHIRCMRTSKLHFRLEQQLMSLFQAADMEHGAMSLSKCF